MNENEKYIIFWAILHILFIILTVLLYVIKEYLLMIISGFFMIDSLISYTRFRIIEEINVI